MSDNVVEQIVRDDGLFRLSICRRPDGLFFYREDWLGQWNDAPWTWMDGHPPSGIFATSTEAEAEARASIPWLRHDG